MNDRQRAALQRAQEEAQERNRRLHNKRMSELEAETLAAVVAGAERVARDAAK